MKGEPSMKQSHLLILTAVFISILGTYFISGGMPTGFTSYVAGLGSSELEVNIGNVEAFENEAAISWQTSKTALSVLKINGNELAFSAAKEFSKSVKGLEPGKRYDYTVRACDEERCVEKSSYFVTATQPIAQAEQPKAAAQQITGQATAAIDSVASALKSSVNIALYILIGIAAVAIAGRIGYEQISSKNSVTSFMKNAEKLIEEDRHNEAHGEYAKAREAYSQLENEGKLQHYDRLIQIYHKLKQGLDSESAQQLADKYAKGTITKEELKRLNEMLSK